MRPRLRRVLVALAALAGCPGGSMSTSATEGDTTSPSTSSTSTGSTDGMSSTTAATTSTSTTSKSTTDETTGPAPVCPTPEAYGCDIWGGGVEDCCADEKCAAWSNDGGGGWNSRCVPLDPEPDKVGEPCSVVGVLSGIDSCERRAMCWNVDPKTNTGVCVGLCDGDYRSCIRDPAACCPLGLTCVLGGVVDLILCLPDCDPLLQNCEANGQVCIPVGGDFDCVPAPPVTGAAGDPCDSPNACDPGLYCGDPLDYPGCDPNAAGCCIPFCPLDDPLCPPGTECLSWYDPRSTPLGDENLGACRIPP